MFNRPFNKQFDNVPCIFNIQQIIQCSIGDFRFQHSGVWGELSSEQWGRQGAFAVFIN